MPVYNISIGPRGPSLDIEAFKSQVRWLPDVGPIGATRLWGGGSLSIMIEGEKSEIAMKRLNKLVADGVLVCPEVIRPVTKTVNPAPEAPMPAPVTLPPDLDADDAELVNRILSRKGISEARVLELIQQHGGRPAHVEIDLRTHKEEVPTYTGLMHHKFPLLLAAVAAGVNIMLVGPAGSGKTTAAVHAAQALDLPFYGTGAINSEYKLTGFIDAQGRIVCTAFRKAFEHGGVFLFDEMDASMPSALLAFNAALANDWMDFPDANVRRHKDFRVISGANTFGMGADRQYVGRNQLDAASIDRYAVLDWNYDEALEAAMIGAPAPPSAPAPRSIAPVAPGEATGLSHRFIERVRKVRGAVSSLKVRHVVSPRATVNGSRLLAAGWNWNDVEDAVLWKGMDLDTRNKVNAAA